MLKLVLAHLALAVAVCAITDLLPLSTDPDDIGFYLFPNPEDFSDFDILDFHDLSSIDRSRFSSSKNVIILSHGFTQNLTSDFPTVLIKAYLNAGFNATSNIIAVDWGKLSGALTPVGPSIVGLLQDLPLYIAVVNNVPKVGKRIQEFITLLESNGKISGPDQVHLIGQSLGAHVSGFAGKNYQEVKLGAKLGRITGTDPAGPLFQDRLPSERLSRFDASFVDTVHTNQGEFGYIGPLGQVDFFVNGLPFVVPQLQPACNGNSNLFCSHNTAPRFYAQSISNNSLIATRQPLDLGNPPAVIFGESCPSGTTGSYNILLTLSPSEVPPE